ncbi:hypothetical protein, partial [Salmonella enterica]|uniref:hypothetical protein n=1 Tax=Salmonella enterica TaxID=28901 RepID=UPI0021B2E0AD
MRLSASGFTYFRTEQLHGVNNRSILEAETPKLCSSGDNQKYFRSSFANRITLPLYPVILSVFPVQQAYL